MFFLRRKQDRLLVGIRPGIDQLREEFWVDFMGLKWDKNWQFHVEPLHMLRFAQIIVVDSTLAETMVCKETSMQHTKFKSKTEMLVE